METANQFHRDVEFSPGARRALDMAARCSAGRQSREILPQALLAGLLGQGECRAAAILQSRGISIETVQGRWPDLGSFDDGERGEFDVSLSGETRSSILRAADWLAEHRQTPEVTTEHLLWGLASGPNELGQWLRSRGVEPGAVEQELFRFHGHLPPDDAARENEPIGEPIDAESPADVSAGWSAESSGAGREPPTAMTAQLDLSGVLRVIDAAANRGREGLRVVEDYVRFVLDDRHLTERLKQFRHDFTALLESIPFEWRLAARETRADVGTELSTDDEHRRARPDVVLTANFCRLQESLRTLEEHAKLFDSRLAAGLEQLRYASYTLQRVVALARRSRERLDAARLYVLLDGRATLEEFGRLAGELVRAGVDVLQLRDKRLDDRTLLERARRLREITQDTDTLFAVNDRPDVALLARADAVHVGQEELPLKDVRALVGPEMLVGVSVHNIDQARAAVLDGADYLGVGPTFASATKTFDDYPGPDLLRAVASEISLPSFAIGGIDRDHLPEVLATGIRRIAVSAAIVESPDPPAAATALKTLLQHSEPRA